MKTGLWIDHSKAVVVSIAGKKEEIITLESNVNKHFRSQRGKNDSNPNGRDNLTPDDIQERQFTAHLNIFYKRVIASLPKHEAIYIFGPGEPKGELAKMIKQNNFSVDIADVVTAGKMTDRQIAAQVRKYFISLNQQNKNTSNTARRRKKVKN